jgi:hypothetical protein
MSLRIHRLRLSVTTASGLYGVDIPFDNGLVIIRADNTSGKSTCVQSILYALGLEAMLTARHEPPLPPAMTQRLLDALGRELDVLQSHVLLEVEGTNGRRMTVRRAVKDETRRTALIQTWDGWLLSEPDKHLPQRDYFVRMPGAATHESGFHFELAKLLGWDLPILVRPDGTEAPLYVEMIFPLLCVEQKRGWGGIQVQMPPYAGVPEPRKRAIEFVLGLGVYQRVRRRLGLRQQEVTLGQRWKQSLQRFRGTLDGMGVVLQDLPESPPLEWPLTPAPRLTVAEAEGWRPIAEAARVLRREYQELVERTVPQTAQLETETSERLSILESDLAQVTSAGAELAEETNLERAQLASIDRRLQALTEDRRKTRDIQTLQRLGGQAHLHLLEGECPTCHQQIPQSLVEQPTLRTPMSVDENLAFIDEQMGTFRFMRQDASQRLSARRERLAALRDRAAAIRREIRAARTTLVSPEGLPSVAVIQRQLEVDQRIRRLADVEQSFVGLLDELAGIVVELVRVRSELVSTSSEDLSDDDERHLHLLETSFLDQVQEYGFGSFPVSTLGISRVTYLPTREGFDIGHDVSASDWIRVIWAYLLGLLEVSRRLPSAHPGLLIFDEPRQQETDPSSFRALLRRASQASSFDQQVILVTSEPPDELLPELSRLPHQYIPFVGRLLRPFNST